MDNNESVIETLSDPYEVLGIHRNASAAEIRRGYRERVKACHPDLGQEPGRMELFKRVNQAYRLILGVLEEEERRRAETASPLQRAGDAASSFSVNANWDAGEGPDTSEELIRAAQTSYGDGKWADAEAILRIAVQRYPKSAPVYILMAKVLTAQERFAEAIGCLTLALEWEPRSETARTALDRIRHRD